MNGGQRGLYQHFGVQSYYNFFKYARKKCFFYQKKVVLEGREQKSGKVELIINDLSVEFCS